MLDLIKKDIIMNLIDIKVAYKSFSVRSDGSHSAAGP